MAAVGATVLTGAVGTLATARAAAPAVAAPAATGEKWIDAWAVSFLPTTVNGTLQNVPSFNNQTVRFMIFTKLGGTQARVKFTNKFSTTPLTIGDAHIALRDSAPPAPPAPGAAGAPGARAGRGGRGGNPAIAAGTDHALTFKGEKSVTIPPGEDLWSDPVKLAVPQHADVAISVFIPALPAPLKPTGFHPTGLKTSYISAEGDHTAEPTMPAAAAAAGRRGPGGGATTDMVFFISDLQVMAPAKTHVIVTLGDSITDGSASATDANGSWPDVLSKRLPTLKDGTPVAVINMGIGSNRFVSADAAGPSGVKRFDEDVLARPNVTHLIVMEGINDISYENVKPETLIEGYKSVIAKARAKGIKVYGATLLPIQNSRKDTPENIATQQAVNKWIRTTPASAGGYDAVLDFEKVVQDPANPLRIRADLTGDYVHPNTQGYKLMADAVDLALFE